MNKFHTKQQAELPTPRHSYSRRYSHAMKPPYPPSIIRAVGC